MEKEREGREREIVRDGKIKREIERRREYDLPKLNLG
jgi:hypothetical protein